MERLSLARESIFNAWSFETDPANLQPRIRRLNREVAEFLRANPPAGAEQDRIQRALDAVEAPWPRREENQLRAVWKQELDTPVEKAVALLKEIEEIGVEPFRAPEPLPPISPEDISLICWLAIPAEPLPGG